MNWFVRPETTRIALGERDYLILKKRLTVGEQRAAFARTIVTDIATGRQTINPALVGFAKVLAYLVDWSLTDPDGRPVVIRGASLDVVQAALDALDSARWPEITAAIEAHAAAMEAEREAEKKTTAGSPRSAAILPSPVAAAGVTSGSATSMPMSTTP